MNNSNWTAIIPAAGRGSRLGFDRPKILTQIKHKSILQMQYFALSELCSHFIVVASPAGFEHIKDEISRIGAKNITIVIQDSPTGMGDAIKLCEKNISTKNSFVIWGDQPLCSHNSIKRLMEIHEKLLADLTFYVKVDSDPYINIIFDPNNNVIDVQERREGDTLPALGISDCGMFCFDIKTLFDILDQSKNDPNMLGFTTKEFGLLKTFKYFSRANKIVCPVPLLNLSESQGINTIDDLEKVINYVE